MNDIKIGIISTQFAINFGAVLQAYALRKKIENLGYNCEIINYVPNYKVSGRNKIPIRLNGFKNIVLTLIYFLNFKYRLNSSNKIKKFDHFIEQFCNLSKERYSSYLDLRNRLPQYDSLICGSDQIWNLNLFNNDLAFFLRFEDIYPKTNYISYAPSIAEDLTSQQYENIIKNILHFKFISIREKSGATNLSKYTDMKIQTVLDPVFLLDENDWSEIEEPMNIKKPYLLNYGMVGGKRYYDIFKKIRKNLCLDVVNINLLPFNKFKADYSITDMSPGNFIWLLRNADFVYTGSFHGTAFSIIFEKQFLSIPADNRNSRHKSLLEQLGLDERLIQDDNSHYDASQILNINYNKVKLKLNQLKIESILYLKNSIKND